MKLPHLFRQIHGTSIFNAWVRAGRPPIVRVIPQEPLRLVEIDSGAMPDNSVTVVSVKCWNDRGSVWFEAASVADLNVAKAWAERHAGTPPEDFKWFPELT
jgi:hypothetical protein